MNGRPKIRIRGGIPVLPHNVETERAVLGAVMLDSRLFHEMSNDARLTADDFMRPPHQNLWELYGQMAAEGMPIDLVGVLTRIGHDPEFFGGVAHVAALPNAVPSTEGAKGWARQLKALAARRRVILVAKDAEELAADPSLSTAELIQKLRAQLDAVEEGSTTQDSWKPMSVCVSEALDDLQKRVQGIETGISRWLWPTVQAHLGSMEPGETTIIGARPGTGKTSILQQVLTYSAEGGVGCGLITMEMLERKLAARAIAMVGQVENRNIRDGKLSAADYAGIQGAGERLDRLPLWMDYAPGMDLGSLRAKVYALKRKAERAGYPLGVLGVDYLGLMTGMGDKETPAHFLAKVSRGIKILAGEVGIHIVVLVQLNRAVDTRTDKRPAMSDIRDSGAIEQDASGIIMISRDDEENPGKACLSVVKSRNGTTGDVMVEWIGRYFTFGRECR